MSSEDVWDRMRDWVEKFEREKKRKGGGQMGLRVLSICDRALDSRDKK